MHSVPKKKKRRPQFSRLLMLIALVGVLIASTIWYLNISMKPVTVPESVDTYHELYAYDPSEVRILTVTQQDGDTWTLRQDASGVVTIDGCEGWPLDRALIDTVLMVGSVVSWEDVLTDDPAEYTDHLADFGLAEPKLVIDVTYADGQRAVLRIGDKVQGIDMSYAYMLIEGSDSLYVLDQGTVSTLNVDKSIFRDVAQPVIHKARIDRITFTSSDGQLHAAWALEGHITDADAAAQWMMTYPSVYPADAVAVDSLRHNLSNIRLGVYVCEATPENMTLYGFDQPRFTIELHQAAGTVNSVSMMGVVEYTDYPESSLTFVIGGRKSDYVDYLMYDGAIYTASNFTLDVFMGIVPLDTISRYPVMVACALLDEMIIEQDGVKTVYRLERNGAYTQSGSLPFAGTESPAYETTVTRDGEEIPYAAFEAAYIRMETARISGLLPAGWQMAEPPHTVFTLTSSAGSTHTIALSRFDAMHDAVIIDGCSMFYIIRGGLAFSLDLASAE